VPAPPPPAERNLPRRRPPSESSNWPGPGAPEVRDRVREEAASLADRPHEPEAAPEEPLGDVLAGIPPSEGGQGEQAGSAGEEDTDIMATY
jgi:hypothetical protein